MSYLEYPLFAEGYINRFLITGVYTKRQRFEKAVLQGRVNEWLKKGFAIHENPCRNEFVSERRNALPEYLDLRDCKNGDMVTVFGQSQPLSLYVPFGNTGVDASGFYYEPTYLRMYGYVELYSEAEEGITLELETCGGITLWMNEELVTDFTPFTRNLVKCKTVSMPLKKGTNRLLVCLDDLAERDTDFYFRMKSTSEHRLVMRIPADQKVEQTVLDQIEESLNQMYFEKEAYISEAVRLQISNPFDRPFPLEVVITPGEFIEKMQDSWKLVLTKKYEMMPEQNTLELLKADEISPGYYYFTVKAGYQGMTIARKIGNQLVRQEFLNHQEKNLEERKACMAETILNYAPENTYKAAVLFFTGREQERAEAIILEELEGVRKRKDCSDFHFIVMIFIYHRFYEVLSERLKRELEEAMLGYRYWIDEPGDDVMWFFSENHALLFHCCQYLAGSYLPDRLFINSNTYGREVKQRGEELLHEWFEAFFKEVITEWNSNAYIPVDVLGIGTLYNLTEPGSALHEKAKRAMDMIFYSLCLNSHKGAVMTSFGRTYEKEMKGNYNAGTTSLLYVSYCAGYLNRACNGVLPLVLGDYEAPVEYRKYACLKDKQYLIYQNTQGFEQHVNLYLYKNADVLLSTAVGFKPFLKGYQEHIVQAAIDETAQAFINHPGEPFPYGSGRPSFWAGNGYLPLAVQYLNTSIVRYHIPSEERIDVTHLYAPLSEFSNYYGEDGILILAKHGGYIAVRALNGLRMETEGPNCFREFISSGRDNVWIMRVGSIEGHGWRERLIQTMKQFEIEMEEERTRVVDEEGNVYCFDREHSLTVNGEDVYEYPLPVEGKVVLEGGFND